MFQALTPKPEDPLFLLYQEYQRDPRPRKYPLSVGIYFTPDGHDFVLPSVQEAAKQLTHTNYNYKSIRGNEAFLERISDLLFPSSAHLLYQTAGGTHGLFLAHCLLEELKITTLILGTPTWGNYSRIFSSLSLTHYPHLTPEGTPNGEGFLDMLRTAPPRSAILLQGGSGHNPTGLSFSREILEEAARIIAERGHLPIIDYAYLGIDESLEEGKELIALYTTLFPTHILVLSFSKNLTLYKHRLGLIRVCGDELTTVHTHLAHYMRKSISNPPDFGAELALHVLHDGLDLWEQDLSAMRRSIDERRAHLARTLTNPPHSLTAGNGFFALLPLGEEAITALRVEHGVYIPSSGRINLAGIPLQDIPTIGALLSHYL
jgi:aromatic-amino-acid transaminase